MATLYYLVLLALPVVPVVVAVKVDRRMGRGFGLGALATLLVALFVWMSIAFYQADQRLTQSHTDNLDAGIVIAVYAAIFIYLTLVLWVGGLTLAGIARQRWWLAGIFVSGLVPVLFVVAAMSYVHATPNLTSSDRPDFFAGFILSLAVPPAVILAYGLARTLRPSQPAPQQALAA